MRQRRMNSGTGTGEHRPYKPIKAPRTTSGNHSKTPAILHPCGPAPSCLCLSLFASRWCSCGHYLDIGLESGRILAQATLDETVPGPSAVVGHVVFDDVVPLDGVFLHIPVEWSLARPTQWYSFFPSGPNLWAMMNHPSLAHTATNPPSEKHPTSGSIWSSGAVMLICISSPGQ